MSAIAPCGSAASQFLSRDPAVATTLSPYGYVDGNPLNSTDSTGLTPPCPTHNCANIPPQPPLPPCQVTGRGKMAAVPCADPNTCFRAPWQGDPDNSGCETVLDTKTGMTILAPLSLAAGGLGLYIRLGCLGATAVVTIAGIIAKMFYDPSHGRGDLPLPKPHPLGPSPPTPRPGFSP